MKLTVIIPAAGKGSRLNLPYSKEIMRVNRDQALIDYTFDLFDGMGRDDIDFIVVINEYKTDIVRYLAKYKNKFNLSFTFQDPDKLEYTGAIKSAKHLFGEYNIVLLPDTLLTLFEGQNLVRELHVCLETDGFTFLFKNEGDEKTLSTKGCLKLNSKKQVIDYEDKPSQNFTRFDGYWCGFGFKKSVFDNCISFMEKSTLKIDDPKIDIRQTKLFGKKVIEIKDYKDLGTWEQLVRLFPEKNIN